MTRPRSNSALCACSLLAVLGGAVVPPSVYATSGLMIIKGTTTLKESHTGQIRFGANGITLDCAGRHVSYSAASSTGCGTGGASSCGIHSNNRTGITIKNCKVTGGYDYGVWIQGTTTKSSVQGSSVTGAAVGFRVDAASNLRFERCAAVSNGAGFEIRGSTNILFLHTDAVYSAGDGFDINNSTNTRINYAFVFANGVNGIEFDGSPGSRVLDSEARNNGKHGVSLDDSSGVYISANVISGNVQDGLRLQNVDSGTLRYNRVDNNGSGCNASQDAQSTGNTWTGNTLQNWCGVPNPH